MKASAACFIFHIGVGALAQAIFDHLTLGDLAMLHEKGIQDVKLLGLLAADRAAGKPDTDALEGGGLVVGRTVDRLQESFNRRTRVIRPRLTLLNDAIFYGSFLLGLSALALSLWTR